MWLIILSIASEIPLLAANDPFSLPPFDCGRVNIAFCCTSRIRELCREECDSVHCHPAFYHRLFSADRSDGLEFSRDGDAQHIPSASWSFKNGEFKEEFTLSSGKQIEVVPSTPTRLITVPGPPSFAPPLLTTLKTPSVHLTVSPITFLLPHSAPNNPTSSSANSTPLPTGITHTAPFLRDTENSTTPSNIPIGHPTLLPPESVSSQSLRMRPESSTPGAIVHSTESAITVEEAEMVKPPTFMYLMQFKTKPHPRTTPDPRIIRPPAELLILGEYDESENEEEEAPLATVYPSPTSTVASHTREVPAEVTQVTTREKNLHTRNGTAVESKTSSLGDSFPRRARTVRRHFFPSSSSLLFASTIPDEELQRGLRPSNWKLDEVTSKSDERHHVLESDKFVQRKRAKDEGTVPKSTPAPFFRPYSTYTSILRNRLTPLRAPPNRFVPSAALRRTFRSRHIPKHLEVVDRRFIKSNKNSEETQAARLALETDSSEGVDKPTSHLDFQPLKESREGKKLRPSYRTTDVLVPFSTSWRDPLQAEDFSEAEEGRRAVMASAITHSTSAPATPEALIEAFFVTEPPTDMDNRVRDGTMAKRPRHRNNTSVIAEHFSEDNSKDDAHSLVKELERELGLLTGGQRDELTFKTGNFTWNEHAEVQRTSALPHESRPSGTVRESRLLARNGKSRADRRPVFFFERSEVERGFGDTGRSGKTRAQKRVEKLFDEKMGEVERKGQGKANDTRKGAGQVERLSNDDEAWDEKKRRRLEKLMSSWKTTRRNLQDSARNRPISLSIGKQPRTLDGPGARFSGAERRIKVFAVDGIAGNEGSSGKPKILHNIDSEPSGVDKSPLHRTNEHIGPFSVSIRSRFLPKVKAAMDAGRCGLLNVQPYLECASGGIDNSECCAHRGIAQKSGPQCEDLCRPSQAMRPLGLQHIVCGNVMQDLLRCHHSGIREKSK